MADSSDETRREVEAALATRAELGPEYEEPIAAGLADRVEQLVALRMAETRRDSSVSKRQLEADRVSGRQGFVLAMVSVGAGIPITAIAGTQADPGIVGIAVAWAGLVGVNLAHAWSSRRSR
jgi:hypothetical protein